eukprot:15134220-Heterocapsa_arctica.AAC.2
MDFNARDPTVLQLSKKAQRGWLKLAPEHARDPCPEEAMFLLCEWWVHHRGRMGAYAAAAALISFDCYLRPGS